MQMKILESVTQEFAGSLRRVAIPPMRDTQPVTQFCMLMLLCGIQPCPADEPSIGEQRDGQMEFSSVLNVVEELHGILAGVRVRNAQSRCGHFARSDQ